MATYRPYQSPQEQPSFNPLPPNQNPIPAAPVRPQYHGNQIPQNWGLAPPPYPQNLNQLPPNLNIQTYQQPGPPLQRPLLYPFQPPPPPPPPDSSYAPPPPPPLSGGQNPVNVHQQYYPSLQFSQEQPLQPPPPPPPPSSSVPPPPPPPASPPPPPPQDKGSVQDKGRQERDKRVPKEGNQQNASTRLQKPPVPPGHGKKTNGPSGRVETEEERRLRKKREMEKLRQEEKRKQQLKEVPQSRQKGQVSASGAKGHGSISGSRIGSRVGHILAGDRDDNPLKRPTSFLCRMKFRNELPDPSAQMKLMKIPRDEDRFTRYTVTSLEKMHKPQLYVEPDLGIPLDLLDLSVYNPPKDKRPLAPEDEELLRDDEPVAPLKKDGIRKKDRPSDEGVSWLVKTQYISPLSNEGTKQSLTEKQAKELREKKEGRNFLENLNDRERQIRDIEASFEACKSVPVHPTNKNLKPVEVFPLLPYFDRYDDQFVMANFDGEPTADAEMFSKMPKSVREEIESKAVMKSFTAPGSDPAKPDRFLGYMAPSQEELSKDNYAEDEDISYNWVREYNWDVKGEDLDDPSTFVVAFDDDTARYLPLPTKLALRKRRAKAGKSQEEGEQFVAPGKLTVRRRETTAVIERKEPMNHSYSRHGASSSKGAGHDDEEDQEHMDAEDDDQMGQYSGAEADEYMSD